MKAFVALMLFTFTLVAFTSCKKTYKCHCNYKYGQFIVEGDIKSRSREEAKKQCESGNDKPDVVYTCELL